MQLEYFYLIDRIVDLNIGEKTITVEAQVPQQNTIFEGHFPGYPLLPGVLLIESMAQTSGWLLIALMRFERMPFLAMVKEAKMRSFVSPGELLKVDASVVHEGSGFAVTEARISVGGTLTRAVLTLIAEAAREMAEHGTFGFARGAIPYAELQQRFSR